VLTEDDAAKQREIVGRIVLFELGKPGLCKPGF
jgi:hypothetical protein